MTLSSMAKVLRMRETMAKRLIATKIDGMVSIMLLPWMRITRLGEQLLQLGRRDRRWRSADVTRD
jgi:hypothetical protein